MIWQQLNFTKARIVLTATTACDPIPRSILVECNRVAWHTAAATCAREIVNTGLLPNGYCACCTTLCCRRSVCAVNYKDQKHRTQWWCCTINSSLNPNADRSLWLTWRSNHVAQTFPRPPTIQNQVSRVQFCRIGLCAFNVATSALGYSTKKVGVYRFLGQDNGQQQDMTYLVHKNEKGFNGCVIQALSKPKFG